VSCPPSATATRRATAGSTLSAIGGIDMDTTTIRTPLEREMARFRNQFPVRVKLPANVRAMLELEQVAFDVYPVYRCLNRLFFQDTDGEFYGAY